MEKESVKKIAIIFPGMGYPGSEQGPDSLYAGSPQAAVYSAR